ncbi:MAG: response regulator [Chitinophagaceae bacterium]|nr:response regulator [Chitinophagaceae bacterium]
MKSRILLIPIALLFAVHACLATDSISIKYLGIDQGLSNNSITSICQDHNGFMWLGTYDGLNRYDGYEFKIYRKQPGDSNSLNYNRITSIAEDQQYRLWIGTMEGLSIFNPVTAKFTTAFYIPFSAVTPKQVERVNTIKPDEAGNVFIATTANGLLLYSKPTGTIKQIPYKGQTNYEVTAIEFDNKGTVWLIIKNEGLCKYDYKTNTINVVNHNFNNGTCLKADGSGYLFIGADNGMFRYSISGNSVKKIFTTAYKIIQLTIMPDRKVWIASDGSGVLVYDKDANEIKSLDNQKQQISSTAVYNIYRDKENRVWIGTLRGGLNIIAPRASRFQTIRHDPFSKNSIPGNFVSAFCEDEYHNIWIGTDGSGLSYWNRATNHFINYRHLHGNTRSIGGNQVTSIITDRSKNLWITTWDGGINRFNPRNSSFEKFNCFNSVTGQKEKSVWKIYEDHSGVLWASTFSPGSVYRFNRKTGAFELFDDKLTEVISITEDRNNTLWMGDGKSLIKIDSIHKKHERYFVDSRVRAIYEDKKNNLWIGTEDGGLLLFNRNNGSFKRYTDKEGLCSNAILNIVEDGTGYLWLSTFNGISRLDPVTMKFTNYSQSDGLQSNQFIYNAALQLQSGEMLFGGIKGFNIFYPDSIHINKTVAPVLISSIRVNNTATENLENYISKYDARSIREIKIPFNKGGLSIDFLTPEYSSPDKIQYAYYLEGRDNDWIYTGKTRTVNYSGLNEGTYTFKVKSSNNDGLWNNQQQQLTIIVMPPWYRSWWAYLVYACAAASLIYLYVRYKVDKERLTYEVAWTKKEAEKEKELNDKKLQFFTNVSHEFRSPLTLIINPLKELLFNPQKNSGVADLSIVYCNARRLLSLVDQLLLFQKVDADTGDLKITRQNFSALCREVYECFSYLARVKNIQYKFICDSPDIELTIDREKIEIVLFNLISNALKFTPHTGGVTVSIEEDDQLVRLSVKDTGSGIDSKAGNRVFERFYQQPGKKTTSQSGFGIGLYLTKQLIDAHKGAISYTSEEGRGTEFLVTLKKGTAHFNGLYIYEDINEEALFLNELTGASVHMDTPAKSGTPEIEWQGIFSDKKTVLIVDDNNEIRQYLLQIFSGKFIVYEAVSAEAGWDMATKYMPDIIISDVIMGGITGIEFCRKIKEAPSLKHIPVILLTASLSSEIKLNGIECGADDYITKPFEKDLLIARVNNILKSRSTLQQYFFDRITLQKSNTKVSGIHKEFLEKCIAVVERNIDNEDFTIKMLMKEMNLSHSGLYKKVKAISGESVNAFIRLIRLRKAAVLLLSSDINIGEAAFKVGFSDVKYFRQQFARLFGMPPSEYVKRYKSSFDKEFHVTEILRSRT